MIIFEIAYDQCTNVVYRTFEVVLGVLGQIFFFGAVGEFSDPPEEKNQQSIKIKIDGNFWIDIGLLIVMVKSFSKIHQKLTELWSFQEIKAITKLPISQNHDF
ncbi:unnamed protein product [Meganyctiphanes norvegica]|uniref:Uncharacterized protein n=1 Tax=Meganyctiphanes norvegica TaxID=48144 RepID=A0AAV2Q2Z0_MEGNR